MHKTRARNHDLRNIVGAGGRCRVHRGSTETGDCEGDDEGADNEVFHFAYFSLSGV